MMKYLGVKCDVKHFKFIDNIKQFRGKKKCVCDR